MNEILNNYSIEELNNFIIQMTLKEKSHMILQKKLFSKTQIRNYINEKEKNTDTD